LNNSILDEILRDKEKEVEGLLLQRIRFSQAFKKGVFNVIAEVKRHSPSAGMIDPLIDPVKLAQEYEAGGAAAISILTDKKYFHGSLDDLKLVSRSVSVPLLRKDFLIHISQIGESYKAGASAILLIVAAVGDRLKEMLQLSHLLGMDALVEIHDERELALALEMGAQMIGVNNRNLKTMEVNLENAEKLASLLPNNVLKVAESGIKTLEDALRMKNAGYDAILMGEGLVTSSNPSGFLKKVRSI
jgi:indole-3-glycerol phosphate synthase